MGIEVCQYRQAIGLFNRTKFVCCQQNVAFIILPMIVLSTLLITLLLLIFGLELNPGPDLKVKNLKICHVNIRGLNQSKLNAIRTSLCQVYDIITLAETFLNQNIVNSDLTLIGYQEIIRRDRPTFGGGVAVYVKEGLAVKRLVESESNNLEQIWLQVNTIEGKLFICTAYRPPNNLDFWETFDYNLEQIKYQYNNVKYYVVLGDLNCDLFDVNGKKMKDLCSLHNFSYMIDEPTRITSTSQTCLDQVLINMPNFVKKTMVLPPVSTNDHCTVGIEFNFKLPFEAPYTRHVWQYKDGDYDGFRNALNDVNWDDCFNVDDVNVASERWTHSFLNVARTFIPNKLVLIRPRDTPWYSNNLRKFKRKVYF